MIALICIVVYQNCLEESVIFYPCVNFKNIVDKLVMSTTGDSVNSHTLYISAIKGQDYLNCKKRKVSSKKRLETRSVKIFLCTRFKTF